METSLEHLPGGDLIAKGLDDISRGIESIESLLVAIGRPRLSMLGVEIAPADWPEPEHRLYERLAAEEPDAAHGRYNALVRRLVSFERALACART